MIPIDTLWTQLKREEHRRRQASVAFLDSKLAVGSVSDQATHLFGYVGYQTSVSSSSISTSFPKHCPSHSLRFDVVSLHLDRIWVIVANESFLLLVVGINCTSLGIELFLCTRLWKHLNRSRVEKESLECQSRLKEIDNDTT